MRDDIRPRGSDGIERPASSVAVPTMVEPTEEMILDEMARTSPEGRPPRRSTQRRGWALFGVAGAFALVALFLWARAWGGSTWIGLVAVALVVIGGLARAAPALIAGVFRRRDRAEAERRVRERLVRGELDAGPSPELAPAR